jgi:hypothetical protein
LISRKSVIKKGGEWNQLKISKSCPMQGFGISGAELSSYASRKLVDY